MKTRAEHVDFIRRNGPEVAALAWERYEEKGRGMVCVIAEEHNEVLGTVPYDFLPAARSGFMGANCPRCGRGFNARRSALTS